jgi:hypothetical protein
MNQIYRKNIRDALTQLSDRDLQQKLWMSDGSGGSDVSSFDEAVEILFTDTGLGRALDSGTTGLGKEIEARFQALRKELHRVYRGQFPVDAIDDPDMIPIRRMASELLNLIPEEATP